VASGITAAVPIGCWPGGNCAIIVDLASLPFLGMMGRGWWLVFVSDVVVVLGGASRLVMSGVSKAAIFPSVASQANLEPVITGWSAISITCAS